MIHNAAEAGIHNSPHRLKATPLPGRCGAETPSSLDKLRYFSRLREEPCLGGESGSALAVLILCHEVANSSPFDHPLAISRTQKTGARHRYQWRAPIRSIGYAGLGGLCTG